MRDSSCDWGRDHHAVITGARIAPADVSKEPQRCRHLSLNLGINKSTIVHFLIVGWACFAPR